ncbi:MAG: hypothetical protein H7138_22150 [Myxococcales bacterium]|nr:hypothetical protein [Myxococcales bacterium]
MAFDDLARHMASRDRKKVPVGSAEEVVAQAEKVSRQMSRTRDLILGLILLVGGIIILGFCVLIYVDAHNPTSSYLRPSGGPMSIPVYIPLAGVVAVVAGLVKLVRGLAGRSR